MRTQHLLRAKKEKNDEYYTRLEDIQKELDRYDFSNLVVGLPADTEQSAFVDYFSNYNKAKKVKYWQDLLNEEMYNDVDVIITNPPFSLYTDFLYLLAKLNKPYYLVAPIVIHRKPFCLLPYVRSGWNRINHFSNTDKNVGCIWITNFKEDRPVFIPEIEKTIYTHNSNGLNVVDKCKDIGKDFKTIPNLCLPITSFMKNYDFYNLSSRYKNREPGCASEIYENIMTSKNKVPAACYDQRSFLINRPEGQTSELSIKYYKPMQQSSKEYIQTSETGYVREVQTYKIMPCDKSYFTKIIINYDPSLLVPYRR